ncbi:MAG: NADH oxidase [Gammaproteobacteria bacterium]|nr:NADH oxidase [Gammaproteobacteria bacterium]
MTAILGAQATGLASTFAQAVGPSIGLELRSKVTDKGVLELSLVPVEVRAPGVEEVLLRVEAAPINPSDMGTLFAGADLTTARVTGTGANTVLTADIPAERLAAARARMGQSLAVGMEGAGTVIEAGSSAAAQALLGRTVAVMSRALFSQYRLVRADQCLVLHPGTTPRVAAAAYLNPQTAMAMVETMRLEGHRALVHTAAASNLGQILVKYCLKEQIEVVNIVRRQAQVDLLRGLGARHVVDSSSPNYRDELITAIQQTGATLAFDAVGGGNLADDILSAMEAAARRGNPNAGVLGTPTRKQLYIYGSLDTSPTVLSRNFGTGWNIGIWLFTEPLAKIGPERVRQLRQRIADEITTTFASDFAAEVSLSGALQPAAVAAYSTQATGAKYLINPSLAP